MDNEDVKPNVSNLDLGIRQTNLESRSFFDFKIKSEIEIKNENFDYDVQCFGSTQSDEKDVMSNIHHCEDKICSISTSQNFDDSHVTISSTNHVTHHRKEPIRADEKFPQKHQLNTHLTGCHTGDGRYLSDEKFLVKSESESRQNEHKQEETLEVDSHNELFYSRKSKSTPQRTCPGNVNSEMPTISESIRNQKVQENGGGEVNRKSLPEKSNLKILGMIHTTKKTISCEECGKKYSSKSCLNRHKITHSTKKLHRCEICNKVFARKDNLNQHKRSHTGDKPYSCELCSIAFFRKSDLKKHREVHVREKVNRCDVCHKVFSRKEKLDKHKRIHTGENPSKCKVCGRILSSKSKLNEHGRIHSGEKPFSCEQCGAKFSQKSNLNVHEMIHKREKPFGCEVCDKTFSRKATLNMHISRCHTSASPLSNAR